MRVWRSRVGVTVTGDCRRSHVSTANPGYDAPTGMGTARSARAFAAAG